MRISPPREHQPLLFDTDEYKTYDPSNHGYIRNLIGRFAEELTAFVLRGVRHSEVGDYCPDVSCDFGYVECKSAGRSNQIFIYEGRLKKDCVFANQHRLFYGIWSHSTDTRLYDNPISLRTGFHTSLKAFYLVPFDDIFRIALNRPEEPLNTKYGGTNRQTYGSGRRIPLSLLSPYLTLTPTDKWIGTKQRSS